MQMERECSAGDVLLKPLINQRSHSTLHRAGREELNSDGFVASLFFMKISATVDSVKSSLYGDSYGAIRECVCLWCGCTFLARGMCILRLTHNWIWIRLLPYTIVVLLSAIIHQLVIKWHLWLVAVVTLHAVHHLQLINCSALMLSLLFQVLRCGYTDTGSSGATCWHSLAPTVI